MRPAALLSLIALSCAAPRILHPAAPAADFVRVRCATDGRDVYAVFRGHVYAFVPEKRPRLLFDLVGMNVARCLPRADGTWDLTSRELVLYLEPGTERPLLRWSNPLTGEEVPVVHVANDPVQARLPAALRPEQSAGLATFAVDVLPFYPDPLAGDPELAPYTRGLPYQAGEFFVFTAPAAEALDPARASSSSALSWHRVSPWLPWMKMGDRPGGLIYSARGAKVARFGELPAVLRDEIETRLPRFRHAPRCMLAAANETSWTYFARHRLAYERGERFPIPAPIGEEACRP